MAKLTNKQIAELIAIQKDIARAYKYLMREEVVGIAVKTDAKRANGGDYRICNPSAVEVLRQPEYLQLNDKEIGSDIAGLSMALSKINNFLETNAK